jgi:hypothetical protein
VSRTEAHVDSVRSRVQSDEDLGILGRLKHIDCGPQQSDFHEKRQPGAGHWLFNFTENQTWSKSIKQITFCPGSPGAGEAIPRLVVVDGLMQDSMMIQALKLNTFTVTSAVKTSKRQTTP